MNEKVHEIGVSLAGLIKTKTERQRERRRQEREDSKPETKDEKERRAAQKCKGL